jgi:glycogen(starch) synthase
MKVMLASREYPPETGWGGIGSYTYGLAHALKGEGCEVHVVSCTQDFNETTDDSGITLHRVSPPQPNWLDWRLRSRLAQLEARVSVARGVAAAARRIRPDVVEAADWMAEGLLTGISPRVPLVVHLHSPLDLVSSYRAASRTPDTRLAGALERFAARRATALTAADPDVLRWPGGRMWTKRQVIRIPPAITPDLASFDVDVLRPDPTVAMVGRLDELKAPDVLLDALELLRDEVPGLAAVFVGGSHGSEAPDGSDFAGWIKRRAQRCGLDIQVSGPLPRKQVIDLYRRSRVVAVPSRYESFSMTALEAMACGTPAVVTSSCGIARSLEPRLVVRPGSASALAEALRPLLTDRAASSSTGLGAYQLARKEFDPVTIARARMSLYRSLG